NAAMRCRPETPKTKGCAVARKGTMRCRFAPMSLPRFARLMALAVFALMVPHAVQAQDYDLYTAHRFGIWRVDLATGWVQQMVDFTQYLQPNEGIHALVYRANASNLVQLGDAGERFREKIGVQSRQLAFAGDAVLTRMLLEQS